MREKLDTACDIPSPLNETLNYAKSTFPNLDHSLLHDDLWYLEDIDYEFRDEAMHTVEKRPKGVHFIKAVHDYMMGPAYNGESNANIKERVENVLDRVRLL